MSKRARICALISFFFVLVRVSSSQSPFHHSNCTHPVTLSRPRLTKYFFTQLSTVVLVVSTLLEDFHRNDPNCELNQISQVQCEFYAILISDSNETIEILEAIYMTWFTIEFLVRFISCPDRFDITNKRCWFCTEFC